MYKFLPSARKKTDCRSIYTRLLNYLIIDQIRINSQTLRTKINITTITTVKVKKKDCNADAELNSKVKRETEREKGKKRGEVYGMRTRE